jgi:predicted RecB family nuclease
MVGSSRRFSNLDSAGGVSKDERIALLRHLQLIWERPPLEDAIHEKEHLGGDTPRVGARSRLPMITGSLPRNFLCMQQQIEVDFRAHCVETVRLVPTDVVTLFRPSECGLRVYLRNKGEPEEEPSAFELVLRRLGNRHEQQHLATLADCVDLSKFPDEERTEETKKAVEQKAPAIYQSAFAAKTVLNGTEVTIAGRPDFLVLDGDEYLIRDSKLSLRIDEKNHPEIIHQIRLYGWLFEETFRRIPKSLQIHNGRGDLVTVPYDGGASGLAALSEVVRLRQLGEEPYEPVGTSKCDGCGFDERCWKRARERNDISLVMEIDQSLARALVQSGTKTPAELLARYDSTTLGEFKRPWGDKTQKVGARSDRILVSAQVLEAKTERILCSPAIPAAANYVMFDLEGMPPYLDELDKIYMWGLQVFGDKPGEYTASCTDFGQEGDRRGWNEFLQNSQAIFDVYGDIHFVHWSPYEKTYLNKYIDRYGDPNGIAARVVKNLLDLFPITKEALALPLPSYGLKSIERYIGFQRKQQEQNGAWSMAKFIEATEMENAAQRQEVMDEILRYNQEDLAATWAVMEWLREKIPGSQAACP